jgi:predicted amidohydrolase
MKVALLQYNIAWLDAALNMQRLSDLMRRSDAADLYVLPEMFATGFCTQPGSMAEPARGGAVLEWMQAMAAELDAAVAGSVAVAEADRYRNRFYFVMPDGHVSSYDKRHLFGYGGEDACFTAGSERVVTTFRGVRFLLQVCFDLRFPVWSRCRGDYDAILYVANWPQSRRLAWNTLLRARAIENQCYVVGVNRTGSDPHCDYVGESALIHLYGHELVTCPPGRECALVGTLDMEALRTFRSKFPVLADADIIHNSSVEPRDFIISATRSQIV